MSHKELHILTFPLFFQFSWIHSNQTLAPTTLLKLIMAVSSMATSLPSSVHNSQIIILITWLSASFDPLDHHPKTPTYFGYLDIKDRGAQLFLHLLLFDLFWLNIEVPRPLGRWYPSLPYLYSYLHNIYSPCYLTHFHAFQICIPSLTLSLCHITVVVLCSVHLHLFIKQIPQSKHVDSVQDVLPQKWHLGILIILSQRNFCKREKQEGYPNHACSFSETVNATLIWKIPTLYHTLITRDRESGTENCVPANLAKFTVIFLATPSPFTPSVQTPFVSILHKWIVPLKGIKAYCSGHFFSSLFSCENLYVHETLNNTDMLFPLKCLC